MPRRIYWPYWKRLPELRTAKGSFRRPLRPRGRSILDGQQTMTPCRWAAVTLPAALWVALAALFVVVTPVIGFHDYATTGCGNIPRETFPEARTVEEDAIGWRFSDTAIRCAGVTEVWTVYCPHQALQPILLARSSGFFCLDGPSGRIFYPVATLFRRTVEAPPSDYARRTPGFEVVFAVVSLTAAALWLGREREP